MITKKHLKELADIVHMAQSHAPADLEGVAQEILSFAKRHAPNFSQSHWDSYMHRLRVGKPEPYKQYRLTGGKASIARGNTWAESEIK